MKKNRLFILLLVMLIVGQLQAVKIGKLEYSLHADLTATVIGGNEKEMLAGILTIPTSVNYEQKTYDVTAIEDKAFSGWRTLEWVNLPTTIVTIGEAAFKDCVELWFVNYVGTALSEIKPWAFAGCVKLQAFHVPALLSKLGNNAFNGCTSLGSIDFSEIYDLLEEIPPALCKGCTSLHVVNIPPNCRIKRIGDNAFQDCAFHWILIPKNVTNIGWEVFKGCKNLSNISNRIENPFVINECVFDDYHYENVVMGVPKGTWNKYKDVPSWNKFAQFREEDVEDILGVPSPQISDAAKIRIYSLDGRKVERKQAGINIIKMNDGTTKKVMVKL